VRLAGRRVLVTGAASGIGLSIARLFQREGAGVAMLDRDEAALTKARVDGATALVCDVAEERHVRAAVAQAVSALGGLDGVVNSAGIDLMRPFEQMTAEEWARVMAVDLTGPMLVCHAALPALKQAGSGTIVNIASGAALRPLEQRTAYCAAKAGPTEPPEDFLGAVGEEDHAQDDPHDEKGLRGEGAAEHVHGPLLLLRTLTLRPDGCQRHSCCPRGGVRQARATLRAPCGSPRPTR
jgi:hypothetical protein